MGVRLRVRHHRRRPADQVPDCHRRIHARVPGNRRGRLYPLTPRGVEVLARLVSIHGAPLFMRSDNGPEFVSHAILEWISQACIATALSDPGKPWQNGADETFYGKLRDECLSLEWFRSEEEAAVIIEAWRHHYNTVPPHSSLDCRTPHEFKQHNQSIPNRAVLQA